MNIYINSAILNDPDVPKMIHSLRTLYRKRPDLFEDGPFNIDQPFHINKGIHSDGNGLGDHFNFKNNGRTHHGYTFTDSKHKLKIVRLSTLVVINI